MPATIPTQVRALLRRFWSAAYSPAAPPDPAPDAAEVRAFDEYIRRVAHTAYTRLLLLVLIVSLAWWPLDLLTEGDNPARMMAFSWVRGLLALTTGVGALILARAKPGPITYQVFCTATVVAHAILGAVMATLPGTSGLQFFYTLPLIAIVVPIALGPRCALVAAMLVAFWVGALLTGDQPLAVIGAPASFSFGAALASILFGHWLRMLILVSHLNKTRLDALKQTLEERVAAQSEELRALARSVVSARDEERATLSRELHDAMGQELTAMRYGLAFAEKRARDAGASLPKGLGFAIFQLAELVTRLNDTTKRLLLRLRPREVEQLGLARALESLVLEAKTQGSDVTLLADLGTLGDVDERVADVVYRSVQEGLMNARRHAPTAPVRVSLAPRDALLRMRVEDDGQGAPSGEGTGLGLVGLRERAAALSGHARWGPRPDGGFALEVELPRRPPEAAP